jgi:hypothetical protein
VVMAGVVKGGHGGLTYFLSSRRARVYTTLISKHHLASSEAPFD